MASGDMLDSRASFKQNILPHSCPSSHPCVLSYKLIFALHSLLEYTELYWVFQYCTGRFLTLIGRGGLAEAIVLYVRNGPKMTRATVKVAANRSWRIRKTK